jgi:hypothetical protein
MRMRTPLGLELEERWDIHCPLAHRRSPEVVIVDAHPTVGSALRTRDPATGQRVRGVVHMGRDHC